MGDSSPLLWVPGFLAGSVCHFSPPLYMKPSLHACLPVDFRLQHQRKDGRVATVCKVQFL